MPEGLFRPDQIDIRNLTVESPERRERFFNIYDEISEDDLQKMGELRLPVNDLLLLYIQLQTIMMLLTGQRDPEQYQAGFDRFNRGFKQEINDYNRDNSPRAPVRLAELGLAYALVHSTPLLDPELKEKLATIFPALLHTIDNIDVYDVTEIYHVASGLALLLPERLDFFRSEEWERDTFNDEKALTNTIDRTLAAGKYTESLRCRFAARLFYTHLDSRYRLTKAEWDEHFQAGAEQLRRDNQYPKLAELAVSAALASAKITVTSDGIQLDLTGEKEPAEAKAAELPEQRRY